MMTSQMSMGRSGGDQVVLRLSSEVVLPLVWCPPGRFQMGSGNHGPYRLDLEGPLHEVTISAGFWMGRTPITARQWARIMRVHSSDPVDPKMEPLPARGMSWDRAMACCAELTRRLRESGIFNDDWQVTLPTEAQWEYACRAGSESPWFFGSEVSILGEYGWYHANSAGTVQPVGVKRANPWGIHDLYGNVMEWCRDRAYTYGAGSEIDPCHYDPDCALKIVRGGCCIDLATECRSASRVFMNTGNPHGEDTGLRIVCIARARIASAMTDERGTGAMAPETTSTLWSNADRTRQFLIPHDLALPAGDAVLRSRDGRECRVASEAISAFEVSTQAVEAWAKEALGRALRTLGNNLRRSFASVGPSASPAGARSDTPVTPGLDLLAAITNTPRADLDTGALGAALKRYFGDIGTTVADAVSGDPVRIERAKERMAEWSATLREHGTEVGGPQPTAGAAPETGTGAGAAPAGAATEPQQPPAATDASGFAARLRDLAEQFRRRADALAAAREYGPTPPAAPEVGPGDPPSPAEAGQPTSSARPEPVAAEGQAQTTPSASSAAPEQPEPSSAETQAAALEALAEGLEDAAGDAAARLRAQAARLRGGS